MKATRGAASRLRPISDALRAPPSEGWAGPYLHPSRDPPLPPDSACRRDETKGGRFITMAPRVARIEFDGGVVCERCVVADSFRLRLRGLLGRRDVGSDEGLLLVG